MACQSTWNDAVIAGQRGHKALAGAAIGEPQRPPPGRKVFRAWSFEKLQVGGSDDPPVT